MDKPNIYTSTFDIWKWFAYPSGSTCLCVRAHDDSCKEVFAF